MGRGTNFSMYRNSAIIIPYQIDVIPWCYPPHSLWRLEP
jgi:hypothetical protein